MPIINDDDTYSGCTIFVFFLERQIEETKFSFTYVRKIPSNILLDVKINTGNRNNLTDYTADEERHLSLFKFHFNYQFLNFCRRHDDPADEEGHLVGGGDAVLHGRDRSCHRLNS